MEPTKKMTKSEYIQYLKKKKNWIFKFGIKCYIHIFDRFLIIHSINFDYS